MLEPVTSRPCICIQLHVLVQFRDNLTARLQLLGQLHMKLPEDLNAAEQQLRDGDLPELDQQTQLLKKQIQVIAAMHHMTSECLQMSWSDHCGINRPQLDLLQCLLCRC